MPRPSAKRAAKPSGEVVKTKTAKDAKSVEPQAKSDMGFWLFLGCLVIAASLFFRGGNLPFGNDNPPGPDDGKEQVEPDDKKGSAKGDLSKTYVVRVYESGDMPPWLVVNVRNDLFWKDFFAEKLGGIDKLLSFDPKQDSENPEAASYIAAAAKKGVSPPFWLHATDSGDLIQCGPMSESEGVEQIKAKILGVGK